MNIPHLSTPLAVDTLWHTNWWFAVRQVIEWKPYHYFLDSRISGSHREYAEKHIIPWQRREHHDTGNREGTSSPLIPQTQAFLRARISATLDDIPLDPLDAIETVKILWWKRIAAAKKEDRPSIEEQRRKLCEAFQTVVDGRVPTLLALDWILGICVGLQQDESGFAHT